MRIVSVVGTRPQLIKAAALLPELRARHSDVLVDTGQHWDERLAGAFLAELGLPRPDHALGIGGGGHSAQTGRMLAALEPILQVERPDAVLIYGDTNSTLAGSLAAAKLGIPTAHVEAGLQSFDRRSRRKSIGSWQITSRHGALPRRRRPSRTSRQRASRPASSRSAT